VFASLEMTGVLSDLAAKGVRAEDLGENHFLTAATLRYLAQRGVVRADGDVYQLTDFGQELYAERGYLVWLSGGYGEALHRFGDLLTGRHGFRADIDRDVRWVAVGSALVGQKDLRPEVVEVLREIDFDRAADLGCGNAHFLIGLCRAVGRGGIGVDISADACAEARQEVARAGLDDRIEIVEADARDPGNIAGLDSVQLVVTFFFLHEVLEAGYDVLVNYLGQVAARLPSGAHLLTAEITPPERDRDAVEVLSPEYVLTQALMTQNLLSADGWRQAFTESGFQVRRIVRPNLPGARIILAQKAD
jgi:SAM-dependent methyltransferase